MNNGTDGSVWDEYQDYLRAKSKCAAKEPGKRSYCQNFEYLPHDVHRDGDRTWSP